MTGNGRLTIIVPCYNGRTYLEELSGQLGKLDRSAIDVVFVDDGSTDGSTDLFRQLQPDAVCLAQENAGVAAARNLGVDAARTDWILFLDCDDWIDAVELSAQLSLLEDEAADVICADWRMELVDGDRRELEDVQKMQPPADIVVALVSNRFWGPPHSYIFRKSAYEAIGGGDPKLVNAQDFDVWVRMALNGARFIGGGFVIGHYRRYLNTTSLARRNHSRYYRDYETALDKVWTLADERLRSDARFRAGYARHLHTVTRNVFSIDRTWFGSLKRKLFSRVPEYQVEGSFLYRNTARFVGLHAAEYLAQNYNKLK